jgi:hypothetical protein
MMFYQKLVKAGEEFQTNLSTTVPRASRLIIVPTLPREMNDGICESSASPFSSGPADAVQCFIQNFNAKVDDINVYSSPITHKFEHFHQELNGKYGLNNNLTQGMCSGVINKSNFEKSYGYLVVNLEGRESAYDNLLHSITILGKLVSSSDILLNCFIEYPRSIGIDVISGAISV